MSSNTPETAIEDLASRFHFDVQDYVLSQDEVDEMVKSPDGILNLLDYIQKKALAIADTLDTMSKEPSNYDKINNLIKHIKVIHSPERKSP